MKENSFLLHQAQRDIYTDQLIDITSSQYNIGGYLKLIGPLDKAKFHEAVNSGPKVFDAFKMRFNLHESEPYCYFEQGYEKLEMADLDFSGRANAKEAALHWMQNQFNTPFELQKESLLFEQCLLKISADEHWFFGRYHHLITDGYGFIVWVQYVAQKYNALTGNQGIEFNYGSYKEELIKSHETIHSSAYEADALYWKEKISVKPQRFLQKKRQVEDATPQRSITYILNLTDAQRKLLEEIQLSTKSGLQQLTIAALIIYFAKTTGQSEFIFGVPVHKRGSRRLRNIVGTFTGLLPFKGEFQSDQKLAEFLKEIAASQRNDYRHQDYLIGDLTRHLKINSSEGYLSDIVVNYEPLNFNLDFGSEIQGTIARLTNEDETNPLKVVWRDYNINQPLQLHIHFSSEYFDIEEIELLAQRIIFILEQFPANLDENIESINILPDAEISLLEKFNEETEAVYPDDKTIVDLFEQQVLQTPLSIAVSFEKRQLTYKELNEQSNQLAHFLRSQGVKQETLIPICIERSIEMIVGILGVLKAGAAYVPVDPEYPEDRLRLMIEDTAATIVLSSKSSKLKLQNFRELDIIELDTDWSSINNYPVSNINTHIESNSLAYVIYTSGSTGKPKGVCITHGSNVNMSLDQVKQFGITDNDKVLQFASISFDASVSEIFMAFYAGATLVLMDKEKLKDAENFAFNLKQAGVSVVTLPPVFLKALDTDNLAFLRVVITAGEPADVQQATALSSYVEYYNAYGPTECAVCVSIYKVSGEDKSKGQISIGKPIANTQVYILNDHQQLMPIGVAGEIYVSGAGLAKEYLNQPELTAEKFIVNSFTKGGRLYKTGDIGKWSKGGNLEFLGRKDDQIKIRGYRVELGEIENTLLSNEVIEQCVVVVREDKSNKQLVAYYQPKGNINKDDIKEYLKSKLPDYMIPSLFIELAEFPVTISGKIDKKALPAADAGEILADQYAAPRNELEAALTEIWQDLLGFEKIGINDNFFELGGDSIITIQLVSRARQLGYKLEVGDVFTYQTISSLSTLITQKTGSSVASGEQELLTGDSGLLPIQQWYLQKSHTNVSHYNQSVLLSIDKTVTEPVLNAAIEQITAHHDALRFRYYQQEGKWHQEYGTTKGSVMTEDIRLNQHMSSEDLINTITAAHQSTLDIRKGELVRVVWIQTPQSAEYNMLLIVVHHLAIDGVSWRILLEDVEFLINELNNGKKPVLVSKTSSYRQWYESLKNYSNSRRLLSQGTYWKQLTGNYSPLTTDKKFDGDVKLKDIANHTIQLTQELTRSLLQEVPKAYHTEINDILLAALAKTLCEWGNAGKIVIGLEGHGREYIEDVIDTSRTVGWFTTLFPVLLKADGDKEVADWIKSVKENLRQVPDKGLGYGVLKYFNKEDVLQGREPWDIIFNYLGQLDNVIKEGKWLKAVSQSGGDTASEYYVVNEKLTVNSMVQEGVLVLNWSYSSKHYHAGTILGLSQKYLSNLNLIISHCLQKGTALLNSTPSDFGLGSRITYLELDAFLDKKIEEVSQRESIQSIYGLSGLQRGILFHGLYDRGVAGTYISQFGCDLTNVDVENFRKSWELVMTKHSALRVAFYYDEFKLPVQCVYRKAVLPIVVLDYTDRSEAEQAIAIKQYETEDRLQGFDFKAAPLMRFALIRVKENAYRMLWTWHHILLDGWSLPILIQEFLSNYDSLIKGEKVLIKEDNSYEKFIRYIERGDKEAEQKYWQQYLKPLEGRTQLPFIETSAEKDQRLGQNKLIFLTINTVETTRIKAFAQGNHLTINTVMQGVLAFLLHAYTGAENIAYGVTVSGRPDTLEDVESSVGMYINTLPLYSHIQQEEEIIHWLHRLQQEQLASRQFQHTPLFDIQADSNITGDLFDTLLVFENYPVSKLLSARKWNLEIKNYRVHDQSNFPLTIAVNDAEEIFIQFSYNSGIMEDAYIEQLRSHFHHVLLQITSSIQTQLKDIHLLTSDDERRLLIDFNNTITDYPKKESIAGLFEAQAKATPEALAVLFENEQLTYQELNERSNQLAKYLTARGVKNGTLVPMCIDRSIHLIVAILGILKAGGAFVPIDLEYPQERIDYILNDTNATVVITSTIGKEKLLNSDIALIDLDDDQLIIDRFSTDNLITRVEPDNLAYIIYTSGSTGKPKGVMVPHKGNVNMSLDQVRQFNITAEDRILQFASISFDASVSEIFMAFYAGASLVLMRKNVIQDSANFASNLKAAGVSVVTLPPVYLRTLLPDDLQFLRVIITAGEAADVKAAAHLSNYIEYYNAYGPTECSVCVSIYKVSPEDNQRNRIPIGKPIANTKIFILDNDLKLVPVGVQGEIYVSGTGLAKGYLGLPEMTSEKFIISPFDAETTLYKTGDIGRWLPDGNIEFSGRRDDQIKLRGYRIELGEIENVLTRHKDIEKSVVVINEAKEDKQLVIYFQPKDKIKLWPSVAEFYVYDDLLYKTMAGDDARNTKYRNALRKVVKGKVILEIGPGFEAILSRICIEEGAEKVYAVELLEDSYLKAKKIVEDLGLSDKIIVIHDDITKVQLPELADFCVSEIVGAIGGAEGSATLINRSRHLLKDPSCMIPARSLTKIAAVTLPEHEFDCGFEELGAYYTSKIFEQAGHKFDLRVYLSSFPTRNIISNNEVFEDLDYTSEIKLEDEHEIVLKIEQDSVLHGFIVWLNLYCDEDELIDTLDGKYTWLPVYFPAFFNGEEVATGDYIQAKVVRKLSSNHLNPDFVIAGNLVRKDKPVLPFVYESLYCSDTYQANAFYAKIFENDEIKVAGKINKDELRDFLKAQLPEYMIPSLFIEVEKFPLTISGKLDKKALPNPDAEELLADQYMAPRTQTEKDLVEIWKEVLEVEQVGINDDFFELGGHSLLAIRLISVIREELNTEVAIANIFDHPTIAALANAIESKANSTTLPSIVLQARPANIPLSFGQERLWFIHQLEGSVEYHSPAALRLTGHLDVTALEQSLAFITDRHEVLRTVFKEVNGQPYQYIKEKGNWHLQITDGTNYKANSNDLRKYIEELVRKPFDLSKDYMLRATLIRLTDEEQVLVVVIHHIASDAWSMPIIVKELAELYTSFVDGRQPDLPALPLQYADHAIWQRSYLTADVLSEKVAYWKSKLDGVQPLQLPVDFERPAIRSTKGDNVAFEIDKELLARLHQLSQQHGATLFMTLLAAFKVLLYRYTGQQDISVGTSIANRTRQEAEGLIGFFVNTLAFRDEVKGSDTFINLLQQLRTTTLDAYAHQDVPFEKVVEAVIKERDVANSPLFQVMLVLQNTPDVPDLVLGPLVISSEPYEFANVKFDLTFFLAETPQGLQGSVLYSTDLFSRNRIERMIAHFITLLNSVASAPGNMVGSLQMLSTVEESQSKQGFNISRISHLEIETVIALFEKQAVRWPASAAVSFEGKEISYGQLNGRANRLAHYLRNCGVKQDTLVPLFIEPGPDMITGILGVLKAGGAYVPVDTGLPQERISFMLQDTAATVIVCSKESSEKLPASEGINIIEIDSTVLTGQPEHNLSIKLASHNLAYVIYTSGSTGQPKGVMVTHANLTDYVQGLDERTGINSCNSFALVSNIAADLGNTVLYSSLVSGGTLHVFSREAVSNIESLHDYFTENDIDCVKIVPSHWTALVMDGQPLLPRRLLIFGGESLWADQVALIQNTRRRKCRVVNHYGPTETTIGKLLYEVDFGKEYTGTIPIGKPFCDSRIYVLSTDRQLCPAGVPGQLYIGGAGVAKGYLNNAQLTSERFITDPFDTAGSLIYATGDLVKYDPDGNIIFLGRIDNQVKIRGYRVEPGEVENLLQQSELVSQAVVLAKEDSQGNKRLIGYIVPQSYFDRQGILEYVKDKLPEYMIPAMLVELEAMPLTPNGKVDRKALPDPEASANLRDEYAAPQTAAEQQMAAIWQEVLEVEQVGLHDDFFELGGHSLLAIRLISAIRKSFNIEISIGAVFDHPTIAGLLTQFSQPQSAEVLPAVTVVNPRPHHIPLSFSQERLWFIDRLDGSLQYHVPAVLRLRGALNTEALAYALRQIVNRHEILRTVITEKDGQASQFIKEKDKWKLDIVDGSIYKNNLPALQQFIHETLQAPFDLSKDDMIRGHLVKIEDNEYLLAINLHHIVSDGWSRSILVKELVALYESYDKGLDNILPELPLQYADYTIWQRTYLQGQTLNDKLDYWKKQLDGVETLQLPTDFVRPAVQTVNGAIKSFNIDPGLSKQLHSFCQQQGTTLYMTLLAVFNVLLHRYSGQEDICVGTGTAGRQQKELEGLIGFFVNTLAMRNEVRGNMSFKELLQQVKVTTLEAYSNQDVPFEKVVDAVVKERDLSRNPVFHTTFIVQNTPDVPELHFGNVELSIEKNDHITSKFDITFSITETDNTLEGVIEYNSDLYRADTIARMIGHFKELIYSVLAAPDQEIATLQMLNSQEEKHLLGAATTSTTVVEKKSLIDKFLEQVAKTPDSIALIFGNKELSYKELDNQSNKIAAYLKYVGVAQQQLVPICIERSFEMIAGILGILKAGATYVPVDLDYPADRIAFILEDTQAKIILSGKTSRSKISARPEYQIIEIDSIWDWNADKKENKINDSAPEQVAYIIYTSGSTGKPKGVMVEHRSVVNLINAQTQYFSITPDERILQFSNYCFDASVEQIFLALLNGAKLILYPEGLQYNIELFESFLKEQEINHLHATPFFLENITPNNFRHLKRVIAGGDKCRKELADKWIGSCRFYNEYGPTETTVTAIEYKYDENLDSQSGTVSIGKPLTNVYAYVLDKNRLLCPQGIPGELYIGGVQVARGYLNRPQLTEEYFIPDILSKEKGDRLYRTGDLVRLLPDGNLEFLGRIDDQVKIHGYRIEPGETEAVLNALDSVENSCIVVKYQEGNANRLVGYYVPKAEIIKQKEQKLYIQQVDSWKEIHENEYVLAEEENTGLADPEFNIIGWNDSFTRKPIGEEQMREWLLDFIGVVMREKPEYVLEIGCGSGLIYYPLAGKIKKYIGTDFSRHSINQISERISKGERTYGPTELKICAAHEISLDANEPVDTIILNSVVQYFPGADYLTTVIDKSISILKGKGRIIIGDVRDNRLLKAFKARLLLHKLQGAVSTKEFNWAVDQEVLKEEELCFSPEYFYELQRLYPQITNIDIQWKQGAYINELTMYRFTVVLYVGIMKPALQPEWQSWDGEETNQIIINQLQAKYNTIALKDVPNPRLWKERLLEKAFTNSAVNTVDDITDAIKSEDADSEQVMALLSMAGAHGYHYKLLLDENPLKINVLFERNPADNFIRKIFSEKELSSNLAKTNIPLFADIGLLLQKDIKLLLLQKLPEYMVPAELIALAHLPVTVNGKVDRKFLSRREDKMIANKFDYVSPRNPLEQKLADIWQELLHLERAGIYNNFFELGGHSLLAMRVIASIRREMNTELTIKDLFVHLTIAELAVQIASRSTGLILPSIKNIPRPEYVPLSFGQERLWFIDQLEGSIQYHIPVILRLNGHLDKEALVNALQTIINRHEVLRTIIRQIEGETYQFLLQPDCWQLETVSWEHKEPEALQSFIEQMIVRPFDFSKDYMLRAQLINMDEQVHVLLVTLHHIASDGWSTSIIVKEFIELYESYIQKRTARLTTLEIQYADYAIWQRTYLQGEILDKKLAYWKQKLEGLAPLQLPVDYPRPPVWVSKGGFIAFHIDKKLSDQLQQLSQKQGCTLFMTLLASFKVLMYRYSGQQDICIGTSIAGRQQKEVEDLIGFFINVLVLRSNANGNISFTDFLQAVKATTLEAYEHQEVPFEKVVKAVVKERDMSRNPLCQVVFVLQNTPEVPALRLGNLILSREDYEQSTAQYDLILRVTETSSGIQGAIQYCTELFSSMTITRMMDNFKVLLHSVVNKPDELIGALNLMSGVEKQQLLVEFNNTAKEYPDRESMISLFEGQVIKNPGAVALAFEHTKLTYRQLNERANQLAHCLIETGVTINTLVPLCIGRCPEMIIAILGILKAGAVYVPINPEYPDERISYILHDIGSKLIICNKESRLKFSIEDDIKVIVLDEQEMLIDTQPKSNLQTVIKPGQPAYIIYTSGSTGKPKGVMVPHRGIVNMSVDQVKQFEITSKDRILQFASVSFDASVSEMFMAFYAGATLVLMSKEKIQDIENFASNLKLSGVSVVTLPPVYLKALQSDDLAFLRVIITAGESADVKQAAYLSSFINYYNAYGPTECSVCVSIYKVTPDDNTKTRIPIGRPIANTQVYILDNDKQLMPVGVQGEIHVSGTGLADGYLNLPDLTKEKFIDHPFKKGEKLYCTGDIGRWLPDGTMEFSGRTDDQIKIRGFRVEPGEIENTLRTNADVENCVVILSEVNSDKQLIAYYKINVENDAIRSSKKIDKETLKEFLKNRLPDYMVPSLFIELEDFPLTLSGKIDKKALPDPNITELLAGQFAVPRNELEEKLVDIWKELLDAEQVGIYDNFFELGGDSILTIQVVSRMRRFGYEFEVADIFDFQTIAALSDIIVLRSASEKLTGEQGVLTGSSGLLPIQQWYFAKASANKSHYNQSVLLAISKNVSVKMLSGAVEHLIRQHDALRFVYSESNGHWQQHYGNEHVELIVENLQSALPPGNLISEIADKYQRSLDIEKGRLIKVVLVQTPEKDNYNRLLIVVHHLAIDGVSWRIMLEDMEQLLSDLSNGNKPDTGKKSSSYRQWYHTLENYGRSKVLLSQKKYWDNVITGYHPLPVDKEYTKDIRVKDIAVHSLQLSAEQTRLLIQKVPRVYHTEINDILLGCLAWTLCDWSGIDKVIIGLEGHGREHIGDTTTDISRTVGWFTSLYPVMLQAGADREAEDWIKGVKEQLRQVPDKGIGYGVLKYINKEASLQRADPWDLVFNYMGQLDNVIRESKWFAAASETTGVGINEERVVSEKLSVNSHIQNGELILNWRYSQLQYHEATIKKLAADYLLRLELIISHCMKLGESTVVFTPSDYGLSSEISYEELDSFMEANNSDNIMSF